jgi:hypothetical protein
MFLKEIYTHSKLAASALVAIIASFLYINYKCGIVASPINMYGMYSKPIYLTDTTSFIKISQGSIPLNASQLTFAELDLIQNYPYAFTRAIQNNKHCQATLNPFAFNMLKSTNYENNANTEMFWAWYKQKVGTITGKSSFKLLVEKVSVTHTTENKKTDFKTEILFAD